LIAMLCVGSVPVLADNSLSIDSEIVTVPVVPHAAGRNLIRLPAVEFTFRIDFNCNGDPGPGPLTLSIADTYLSLNREQITSESPNSIVLRVPADQIAPVAVADFCVQDAADTPTQARSEQKLIRDALSVQASLVCSSETGQRAMYASRSLDINLECENPLPDQADASGER